MKLSVLNKIPATGIAVVIMAVTAIAQTGTPNTGWYSPGPTSFTISTADELAGLAAIVNGTWGGTPAMDNFGGKTIMLGGNIDLSAYDNWTSIGRIDVPFRGVFNGAGNIISNLYINNSNADYQGLFGAVVPGGGPPGSSGVVRNLGVVNVDITARDYVGGVVGLLAQEGRLINSYSTGEVRGNNNVGGLAGTLNQDGSITNCYSASKVSGNNFAGGLAGMVQRGNITNSYSTGEVSGANTVGGIAGHVEDSGMPEGISNNAALNSRLTAANGTNIGRIVGYRSPGSASSFANNIAFAGIIGFSESGPIWNWNSNLNSHNGSDIDDIYADGTFGGRFPNNGNPWSAANGYLPGFGAFIDLPRHLRMQGVPDIYWYIGNEFDLNYTITEAEELAGLAQLVNDGINFSGKTITLGGDIDLADYIDASSNPVEGWVPIGRHDFITNRSFGGIFDGAGHTISGLRINNPNFGYTAGLFGTVGSSDSVVIKNLNVLNASIIGGWEASGGLVGETRLVNRFYIDSCTFTGTVNARDLAGGGLVGDSDADTTFITNSRTDVSIVSDAHNGTGGLVGRGYLTIIRNSSAAGSVRGGYYVGGLVGRTNIADISDSYSLVNVVGEDSDGWPSDYVGGIVGQIDGGEVKNCYSAGSVTGDGWYIGGVVGRVNTAEVTNCYSVGSVSGNGEFVGGVVGMNNYGTVTGNAALNLSVEGVSGVGRVLGNSNTNPTGAISNNIAFAGMRVNNSRVDESETGHITIHGESITKDDIITEIQSSTGTFDDRFTDTPGGWTLEANSLPHFGEPHWPVHLQFDPVYVITGGSGAVFTVSKDGGATVWYYSSTTDIQEVIDEIRDDAGGSDCEIQFGDNGETLNIVNGYIMFDGGPNGDGWGLITLSGSLVTSYQNANSGAVYLTNGASAEIKANIRNNATGGSGNGRTIYSNTTGTVNIITDGNIEINCTYGNGIAISNASSGTVKISGGTVSAVNLGHAIYNQLNGIIIVDSGTVFTNNSGFAIDNRTNGIVHVNGGSISAGNFGSAVYNSANGTVNISGGTMSTTSMNYGTVSNVSGIVEITGGRISTTSRSAVSTSGGKVTISGFETEIISQTGSNAIFTGSGSELEILGGTISSASADDLAISLGGAVTLGGEPAITGKIQLSLQNTQIDIITGGTADDFNPGSNVYTFDITDGIAHGAVVIANHAPSFFHNFHLVMPYNLYVLDVSANGLDIIMKATEEFSGSGTESSPYGIRTADELAWMAAAVNYQHTHLDWADKHYLLENSIDLADYGDGSAFNSGKGWIPIGRGNEWFYHFNGTSNVEVYNRFKGVFDGGNNIIEGLYINDDELDNAGLFGYVWNGTVKNVIVEEVDITGGNTTGAVTGYARGSSNGYVILDDGRSDIINCYSSGTVRGVSQVGGVVGNTAYIYLTGCGSSATVIGTSSTSAWGVGGVAGDVDWSIVSNCWSSGNVSGPNLGSVGGVIGQLDKSKISDSYSTGNVSGGGYGIGGVVGEVYPTDFDWGDVINCYATGTVTGADEYVGGIVGVIWNASDWEPPANITGNAALNVSVNGMSDVGRVVGMNWNNNAVLSGNRAFIGMEVNGAPISSSDPAVIDGADITKKQISDSTTLALMFTEPVWTTNTDSLPGFGAPVVMPRHLMPNVKYIVVNDGGGFKASSYDGTFTESDANIQNLINAIGEDASGADCEILFGDPMSVGTLSIGMDNITFDGGPNGDYWGVITLTGSLSASFVYPGAIVLINGVSVENTADIQAASSSRAISKSSEGTLTISGGRISGSVLNTAGTLDIIGGTISTGSDYDAVENHSGVVNISGGTIYHSGASSLFIAAVANSQNGSGGIINISGGTIYNESLGEAVLNINNTGRINISGGTIYNTSHAEAIAVLNAAGAMTISDSAHISSSAAYNFPTHANGVVTSNRLDLEILGGTIENTADGFAVSVVGPFTLGGAPVITGPIISGYIRGINVVTSGAHAFAPDTNKYTLFSNYYPGFVDSVIVTGGAGFHTNFVILDSLYMLETRGGDLVQTQNNDWRVTGVIMTAEDLWEFSQTVNGGENFNGETLRLGANIDLANDPWTGNTDSEGWVPIGNALNSFMGDFIGGGYVISNLFINRDELYQGLFGDISGSVDSLGLENVNITGSSYVGAVAGRINMSSSGRGSVANCYSTGIVRGGTNMVGGLVGHADNSDIRNSYSTAAVEGSTQGFYFSAGGLVGQIMESNVINSYSTGAVSGASNVGGIVGNVLGSINNIENCAALNISVEEFGSNIGRVVGNPGGATLTGNTAFDGMLNSAGNNTWSNVAANNIDGADISIVTVNANGTIDGKFTSGSISPWTVAPGRLPGLFDTTVEMPSYLRPFYSGTGASGDPYIITEPEHLANLAGLVNDADGNAGWAGLDYRLGGNIDLSGYQAGEGWVPIGNSATPNSFRGIFDGAWYAVSNLTINRPGVSGYQGLFGHIEGGFGGGVVRRLGVTNATITGGAVGGVAGYVVSGGSVIDCYFSGTVSSSSSLDSYVGGVVGLVQDGEVKNCYSAGSVTGNGYYIGGVVGLGQNSEITNCYSAANIGGNGEYVGGVVGRINGGEVTNCYSTGEVSGNLNVGGVIGMNNYGTVTGNAALNPSVEGALDVGRVIGSVSSNNPGIAVSNNIAFAGMRVNNGAVDESETGSTTIHGESISKADIITEIQSSTGTFGNRFTEQNGWTLEIGSLPHFGTAHLPVYLQIPLISANFAVNKDDTLWTNCEKSFTVRLAADTALVAGGAIFNDGNVSVAGLYNGTWRIYEVSGSNLIFTGAVIEVGINSNDDGFEILSSAAVDYYTVNYSVTSAGTAAGSTISASAVRNSVSVSVLNGGAALAGWNLTFTVRPGGSGQFEYSWVVDGSDVSETAAVLTLRTLSAAVTVECTVTGVFVADNSPAGLRFINPTSSRQTNGLTDTVTAGSQIYEVRVLAFDLQNDPCVGQSLNVAITVNMSGVVLSKTVRADSQTGIAVLNAALLDGAPGNLVRFTASLTTESGAVLTDSAALALRDPPKTLITAQPPVIMTHPRSGRTDLGGELTLTASAAVRDNGELSYQWFVNDKNSYIGAKVIPGAIQPSYSLPIDVLSVPGVLYYYVVITNKIEDNSDGGLKTASAVSRIAVAAIGVDSYDIDTGGDITANENGHKGDVLGIAGLRFITPASNKVIVDGQHTAADASSSIYTVQVRAVDSDGSAYTAGSAAVLISVKMADVTLSKTVWTDMSNGIAVFNAALARSAAGSTIIFTARTVIDGAVFADTAVLVVSTPAAARLIAPEQPALDAPSLAKQSVSNFIAGPNPIAKSSGQMVNFYRDGDYVNDAVLTVYNASGSVINKIKITDKTAGSRRIIGAWDLTDTKGRKVPEGTYLIKGTIKTSTGKSEKISVLIGVR